MTAQDKFDHLREAPDRARAYGRKLGRIKSDMTAEAQDALHAARRSARKARQRAEDAADAMALGIRRRPMEAFTVALVAGSVLGLVIGLAVSRSRSRR